MVTLPFTHVASLPLPAVVHFHHLITCFYDMLTSLI